jgi:hypothetical protein
MHVEGGGVIEDVNVTRYEPALSADGNVPVTVVPVPSVVTPVKTSPPTVTCVGFCRLVPTRITVVPETLDAVILADCAAAGAGHAATVNATTIEITSTLPQNQGMALLWPPVVATTR